LHLIVWLHLLLLVMVVVVVVVGNRKGVVDVTKPNPSARDLTIGTSTLKLVPIWVWKNAKSCIPKQCGCMEAEAFDNAEVSFCDGNKRRVSQQEHVGILGHR